MLLSSPFQPANAQTIKQVTQFEQWPAVSQLIPYQNKIWFVNSQPYEDTNVADIYSYAPGDVSAQYERSLFSQDAGKPVVHEQLLYWPLEDPRRSAGTGEYAVTDGLDWQWQTMQDGRAMHVHAMDVCNDELVAVTGAWTGQFLSLQANDQWKLEYDYPAGEASFSRLINAVTYGDSCLVAASANGKDEAKLFQLEDTGPVVIKDWPVSDRVDNLTIHKDALFAFVDTGVDRRLFRYDGKTSTEIKLPNSHRPRDLHSDGESLWLVSQSNKNVEQRGQLWQYDEGEGFFETAQFKQSPIAITSLNGEIYIGTYSKAGGELLVYANPSTHAKRNGDASDIRQATSDDSSIAETTRKLTKETPTVSIDQDHVELIYNELKPVITDTISTDDFVQKLRTALARHPDLYLPEFGQAITQLLKLPLSNTTVTMFTRAEVSRSSLVRWYLFTTLAINGHGRVELQQLNGKISKASGRSGKIFDATIAAIVATGWLEQNDKPTIAALMERLNNTEEQPWVTADVIGALSAITKNQFGYDKNKWSEWWLTQQ